MIDYKSQETGTELGLFQELFARCKTLEDAERLIARMLDQLSVRDISRLARTNKSLNHFIYQGGFFPNLKSFSSTLVFYQRSCSQDLKAILVRKIITDLQEGANPTEIEGEGTPYGNTVLTAALVHHDETLIGAIFELFKPEHPLFSLRDKAQCGKNTPLSLALKTGRYDIAVKLVVEKECDVDGLIGDHQRTTIHPLHLCAFLLINSCGESIEQKQKLVTVMEAILARSKNKDARLYWGHSPLDVLMLRIDDGDFEVYEDKRNFFEYYLDTLFTPEEVEMGNKIMQDIIWTITWTRRNLPEVQTRDNHDEVSELQRKLEKAEKELSELDDKYRKLIEFAQALIALRESNISERDYEKRQELIKITYETWPQIKEHQYRDTFSRNDLMKKYNGNPPQYFKHIGQYAKSRTFNVAYMLRDHCDWHRSGTFRFNDYFDSAEGVAVLRKLSDAMAPSSPKPRQ